MTRHAIAETIMVELYELPAVHNMAVRALSWEVLFGSGPLMASLAVGETPVVKNSVCPSLGRMTA
ncbi:MAG: hypothetical protein WA996_10670 [Candidatus Promineifilaceae bacterium]